MSTATAYLDLAVEPIEEPLAEKRLCAHCPATLEYVVQINESEDDAFYGALDAEGWEIKNHELCCERCAEEITDAVEERFERADARESCF